MTMTMNAAGKRRLSRIAKEYREKGYQVIVRPEQDELPVFLRGFQPALIALSDNENVVLEIRSREQLTDQEFSIVKLADAVATHKNWRFDLVSTGAEYVEAEVRPGVEPDIQEIRSKIGVARELFGEGQSEGAALIASAAAEAALRRLARKHDIQLDHLQPSFVIRQLYILGLLSDENYGILRTAMTERNVLTHGFRPNSAPDEWVLPLIHATSDLLTEASG